MCVYYYCHMKIFVLVSYIVGTLSYQQMRKFGYLKDPAVDGFILFNIYLYVFFEKFDL